MIKKQPLLIILKFLKQIIAQAEKDGKKVTVCY
jgi:phosphoenolpyruvate-protein kinase (PTS system EI component)